MTESHDKHKHYLKPIYIFNYTRPLANGEKFSAKAILLKFVQNMFLGKATITNGPCVELEILPVVCLVPLLQIDK